MTAVFQSPKAGTQHIMKKLILLALVTATFVGSGCATITRGTTQSWTVETEPSGATVTLSSGETCTSPCTLKKKRKFPFAVDICKTGYSRVSTQVLSSIKGGGAAGMAGNVLVGGLIGIGVDAGSGATKDLTPHPLSVTLEQSQDSCSGPETPEIPEGGVGADGKRPKK
jgi:PEGA domain